MAAMASAVVLHAIHSHDRSVPVLARSEDGIGGSYNWRDIEACRRHLEQLRSEIDQAG